MVSSQGVSNLEDGSHSHVPAYFTSKVQDIDGARDSTWKPSRETSLHKCTNGALESRHREIIKFVVCIRKFRPLHGSSYVETPKCLRCKHCIANVKNYVDKCLMWTVLSAIHPPSSSHVERVSRYIKYQGQL